MKKQFLVIISLLLIPFLVSNVYAAQNSGTGSSNQVQQQTQVVNQGTSSQVQTESNEQVQNNINNGVQVQQQEQQRLQDGSESGGQVQQQNQNGQQNNQGQTSQNGIQQQNQSSSENAQQRRSQVANAVQEMLQVAERNGGIGQQIKTIAQNQNQNQVKLEESLQKVQNRSGIARFFVGPNYGEIKSAEKIIEQNREQVEQLNEVKDQLINQEDQQVLTEQIQLLEQANLEVESILNDSQKGFSLFGWAFRLFSR